MLGADGGQVRLGEEPAVLPCPGQGSPAAPHPSVPLHPHPHPGRPDAHPSRHLLGQVGAEGAKDNVVEGRGDAIAHLHPGVGGWQGPLGGPGSTIRAHGRGITGAAPPPPRNQSLNARPPPTHTHRTGARWCFHPMPRMRRECVLTTLPRGTLHPRPHLVVDVVVLHVGVLQEWGDEGVGCPRVQGPVGGVIHHVPHDAPAQQRAGVALRRQGCGGVRGLGGWGWGRGGEASFGGGIGA